MDKNLKIRNILINSRKILYFLCGKVCGKLFFKILIIYFIYVIVKSNKSTNLKGKSIKKFTRKNTRKFKIFIHNQN